MNILRSIAFAAILLLAAVPGYARTQYTTGTLTNVSSYTITGATHGIGSAGLGVYIFDSNFVRRPLSEYSWTVNASNYNVVVTFSPSFTGKVRVVGAFTEYTSDDHDFKVTAQVGTTLIKVCDSCDSTPAVRAWNGQNLAMDGIASVSLPGAGSDWVVVYLTGRGVVFQPWSQNTAGYSVAGGLLSAGAPSDAIMTLGVVALDSNGLVALGGVSDYRPW